MDQYQQFIAKSRYARWLPEEGRRETWEETVDRYVDFMWGVWRNKAKNPDDYPYMELREAIENLDVMPSMRALMTAGPALERDNVAGFNCAYLAVDHPRAFDEMMYVLMCGTGVGFSVERQYIQKLPEVAEEFHDTDTVINVRDSKLGWATAFKELVGLLYSGQVPRWDVSNVRPSGARLRTFGGRASGPEPLEELFRYAVRVFTQAAGRKLTSTECHDLCCKIAEIVVVGGVRRSALISLSNLTDDRMRRAKSGQWWNNEPQRALANNSACYTEKPDFESFLKEWTSLYESKSGERGIFSRVASQKQAAKNGRREHSEDFGTNPCSEIILRPNQFCNLSEVVVRPEDGLEELKRKVRTATILGTIQATLTDFRYLRKIWKTNTEEEALLGVSLTGIMDHPVLNGKGEIDTNFTSGGKQSTLPEILQELRQVAIDTNKEYADALGINQSAAITCVKPSGTVSQLVDSASGIHSRYSDYYIRTVRADKKDPLAMMMVDQGFPVEEDQMNANNLVFSFPVKAPEGSVTSDDYSAMQQLHLWKVYQDHWCEHKPSVTISYRDKEFLDIGSWVFNNFDSVSGVSFLPYNDHTYPQAPYQQCTEQEYNDLKARMPEFDWDKLSEYETQDETKGSQTMACSGGACEVVDL